MSSVDKVLADHYLLYFISIRQLGRQENLVTEFPLTHVYYCVIFYVTGQVQKKMQ